jgi:HK97 family phage prohead protease
MAAKPNATILLPLLSLRAAVTPASLDDEARTVDLVWTTGARVMRGFFDRYWEELSLKPAHVRMDRLRNGAPLLNAHNGFDLDGVIGVVVSARIKDGEGTAKVRFAKAEDDPAADAIWRKVKDGVIRQVSVGYRIHRLEKVEEEDAKIPVYRAVDWEPMEISMVPMSADAGAGVRAEGAETNPCLFVDVDDESSEERAMAKISNPAGEPAATPAGEPAAPAAPSGGTEVDHARIRKEAIDAERTRAAGVQRAARALGLPEAFADQHVRDGTTLPDFNGIAIEERAKTPHVFGAGGARVEGGDDARDKWLRGAADWLFVRSTTDRMIVEHAKRKGETVRVDPGEFRGLGFMDLARQALERMGVRTAGMDKRTIIGLALTHRAGGYNTTSDFPVLLEGTINRILLAAYATTADTWTQFCATGSVSNFLPHSRVRQGTFGRLDRVNEAGEFKNKPIPDAAAESIFAETFGNIIGITRQSLVNDDMGAFSRLSTQIGRAAKLSVETDVYARIKENAGLGPDMADGDPLFDAGHANLGAGSALSVDGLAADRVVMAVQMDSSGNDFLDLRPSILLVPIGLEGAAGVINDAEFDPDDGTTPNQSRGMFKTIVGTPRLTGTRRYLFADPADAAVLEVVFLDGQQEPFLESQAGWRIDGVEWKVRLDYGIGGIDTKGAVTNAGV